MNDETPVNLLGGPRRPRRVSLLYPLDDPPAVPIDDEPRELDFSKPEESDNGDE